MEIRGVIRAGVKTWFGERKWHQLEFKEQVTDLVERSGHRGPAGESCLLQDQRLEVCKGVITLMLGFVGPGPLYWDRATGIWAQHRIVLDQFRGRDVVAHVESLSIDFSREDMFNLADLFVQLGYNIQRPAES